MLKLEDRPDQYDGRTLAYQFSLDGAFTTREKIQSTINLLKTTDIDGCITGSCLLPDFDPDNWGTMPDVDVFVFGENELVHAVDLALHAFKMEPGTGSSRSRKQEEWKLDRLRTSGLNNKIGVTTYKFFCDGVMLNLTFKQRKFHGRWVPILDTPGVLQSFDMSIVMQGYDIRHHVHYDMRVGDPKVAIPNPLRDQDFIMWTVAKWVRQFDRVVKYYNRGYDTRPMAKFYLDMIDGCIEAGCLFDSEESQEAFESFSQEFLEKRAIIADWYEHHKED